MIVGFPPTVQETAEALLQKTVGPETRIKGYAPVGGGCISHGGKITTTHGVFFIKWNDASRFPGMFSAEASGLQLLGTAQAIRIPAVIGFAENNAHQLLLLEYIGGAPRAPRFFETFGHQLAMLHRVQHKEFGLDHLNYIGSLRQYNRPHSTWPSFFISERLAVQVALARKNELLSGSDEETFNRLFQELPSLLPTEPPTLVHGDLWSGNLIVDERGHPCLIDPAVHFGNREADLAMTRLFGGFDEDFYRAYQDSYPCLPGFEERVDLYNLYPLLVHLNLFGHGYYADVLHTLKKFT